MRTARHPHLQHSPPQPGVQQRHQGQHPPPLSLHQSYERHHTHAKQPRGLWARAWRASNGSELSLAYTGNVPLLLTSRIALSDRHLPILQT